MIYVDLDNTLIDPAKRLGMEMAIAKRYGISENDYWKAVDIAFERCGISNFNHNALFEACCDINPALSNKILNEWQEVINTPQFFPDTLFFLSSFTKEELTLLTTGNPEFQRAKIYAHSLDNYFSKIIIVGSPKCQFITPASISIFVDDSPREIDEMKKIFPQVYCILVREPALWEKQKLSAHKDVQCADLRTAVKLIKQIPR